jgi:hypothetical protein
MPEPVECLSSPSYPGEPVALTWEGERRAVGAILDRWRSPEAIGFLVRTTDGLSFELAYDLSADAWRVTPITTPASPGANPGPSALASTPPGNRGVSRQQEQQ